MKRNILMKICILLLLTIIGMGASSATVNVSVDPAQKTVNVSDTFSLNLSVDPGGAKVAGIQANVSYNATILQASSVTEGNFLTRGGTTFFQAGKIDNTAGTITNIFDAAVLPNTGENTPGNFVTINFKAINPGTSNIAIDSLIVTDSNANKLNSLTKKGVVTVKSPIPPLAIKQILFATGTDNGLWYKTFTTTWSDWISLKGIITSNPVPVKIGTDNYVFVKGTNGAIWFRKFDGIKWDDWESLDGIGTSDPAIVSGQNVLFVRGTNNALWYRKFNGITWTDWKSLGGVLTSNPNSVVLANNLYVFVKGFDNAIWYRKFDGTTWSDWKTIGGIGTSNIKSTTLGGLIYVFVKGTNNDEWYKTYDGTKWSDWKSLGGIVTSDPDTPYCSDCGATKLVLFVKGTNNAEYFKTFDESTWTDWKSLGGVATSNSASINLVNPPNPWVFAPFLYVRGTNDAVYYKNFDSTWSDWKYLGGVILSDPAVVQN